MKTLPITRARLRDHLRYDFWKYALAWALVFMVCDGAVGIIKNSVPDTDKVDIYFVGDVYPAVTMGRMEDELQKALPEYRAVHLRTQYIAINGHLPGEVIEPNSLPVQQSLANSQNQKLALMMGGMMGSAMDAGIMHVDFCSYFQELYLLRPLDEYFEQGVLDETLKEYAVYGVDVEGNQHIYALDASCLRRLERDEIMNTTNMMALIPLASKNPDGAAKAIAWLYQNAIK
nr:hypothetical protein [bacterium]